MGRYSTGAFLFDSTTQLSISTLKKFGYLRTGGSKGTIYWTFTGGRKNRVGLISWIDDSTAFVQISYDLHDGQHISEEIQLLRVPANLGFGWRWYFICPASGKQCHKLYFSGKYFRHRDCFSGGMYDSQTQSKKSRILKKVFDLYDLPPNLKTHYRGKTTARYDRILRKRGRNYDPSLFEKALLH